LHIWALHVAGQNNPTGIEAKSDKDTVPFTPYATVKDGFFLACFCIVYAWFVFYIPGYLMNGDNFIPANPAVTPAEIVPEWYYLPFYAILRSIPDKLMGVIALFSAILVLFGALPSAVQAILLAVGDRVRWPRMARFEATRRHLRHPVAGFHRLLLRVLPDHHAAAWHL
jgi:quinol-cytochrome oxidoreductase complex cytochrome b subunit